METHKVNENARINELSENQPKLSWCWLVS